MNETHAFQKWIDEKDINDVRFFPQNPSRSSLTELMDEALHAVKAHEAGKTVPYEDNVSEELMLD